MAGRKLFLADDSLTIQKVINLTFADEGIEVLTAGDGDAALHRIPDVMPDIVLADVNMPGLTGYELCELLRGDDRTRHIPVILLVGAFEQFDEAEAARVGATSHLTKPFQSIRQLVNQVTDLIEANRPAPEPEEEPLPEPVPYEVPASQAFTDPFEAPVVPQTEPSLDGGFTASENGDGTVYASTEHTFERDPAHPEADDIDRLYRQSIGEDPIPADGEFPDLGVDDEMIETSYTAAQPDEIDLDLLETGTAEPPPHLDETRTVFADDPREPQPVSQYEGIELNAADVPSTDNATPISSPGTTERLDPAMVEAKMAEVNRRFEEGGPLPSQNSGIGEETIRMGTRFDTQGSGDYQFEDIDLLDIPTGVEVTVSTPVEAVSHGGKQVVTLSPEIIEMIAQRVVEKLAEKH